jgi:hypothetical protein
MIASPTFLLTGVSTYLNKVGHHRNSKMKNEDGNLVHIPLDQYEAELLLGISQLIVTYLKIKRRLNGLLG